MSWSSGHNFMYLEYFGSVVLFTALGKFEFLLTDSDMLAYSKFGWSPTYVILFSSPTLYFQYIGFRYFRGSHACCAMNGIIVALDEFRQYIYVSVRIFVCHICTVCSVWYDDYVRRLSISHSDSDTLGTECPPSTCPGTTCLKTASIRSHPDRTSV
jgi:hypothetical protein